MLKKEKIDRINHLAKKSKQEGLTEAEKEEQAVLRKEYIENFREQFKGHLNRVKFVEDLSEEELARLQKENEEIRRANAKAQREQEHLEQSGEQLQEKQKRSTIKTDRIRIEMTAGNSTFPAFCVIR